MTSPQVSAIVLRALDAFFFRGSRITQSGLPHPQTVAGALRTALLAAYQVRWDRVRAAVRSGTPIREALIVEGVPAAVVQARWRGPIIVELDRSGRPLDAFVEAPRVLRRSKDGSIVRLEPATSSVAALVRNAVALPSERLRPLWYAGADDLDPETRFVRLDGLRAFLDGGTPDSRTFVEPGALFAFDERVGIGIDEERLTTAQGLLYVEPLLVPRPNVAFYVETDAPDDALEKIAGVPVRFGGQGRCALATRVDPLAGGVGAWSTRGDRELVMTLTPAAFRRGWLPDVLDGTHVTSAAVGRPRLHSGFDTLKGGPRPTRQLAPPGSVYLLDGTAPSTWSLCNDEEAEVRGEGAFVVGRWS